MDVEVKRINRNPLEESVGRKPLNEFYQVSVDETHMSIFERSFCVLIHKTCFLKATRGQAFKIGSGSLWQVADVFNLRAGLQVEFALGRVVGKALGGLELDFLQQQFDPVFAHRFDRDKSRT